MIENIRKYTGLIIVVVALLFVGLVFLEGNAGMGGNPGDPPVISVDGRTYSYTEFQKGGPSSRQLAMGLGLYEFLSILGGFSDDEQAEQRFFANRMIIREARDEFGVHPSDEQVVEALKAMPTFQGPDGAYDQSRYNEFVKGGIGRLGMTEQDVLDLVRDSLATRKLSEIIGGGLVADREFAASQVASREQQITLQLARIPLSKFKDALDPSEEELRAAWETSKDKYLTEPKIKVTYLKVAPTYPEPETEMPKLPDAITEEEQEAAAAAEAEKKATAEAKLAEEKRRIDDELADVVDAFLSELQASDGKDFESLAQENDWELLTTGLFPRSEVPPELSVNLRSPTSPRPVGNLLFQLELDAEPLSRFTDALPIADGAFLIARLDEVEEARPKTFEEAREEVRTDYIEEKAREALKAEAEEAAAKIREALAAGKTFEEAATELGLEVKSHGPFKATDQLDGEADAPTLFATASTVDPGTLADPDLRSDQAVLVHVVERELVKDPARENRIDQAVTGLASTRQSIAFSAWLNEKLENTVIENLRP